VFAIIVNIRLPALSDTRAIEYSENSGADWKIGFSMFDIVAKLAVFWEHGELEVVDLVEDAGKCCSFPVS
jgi:hypothetical protein